jgi:hypothetical protein
MPSHGEEFTFKLEVKEGAEVRGDAARAIASTGGDLLEMRTIAPTLEEVFMQAVSGADETSAQAASKSGAHS